METNQLNELAAALAAAQGEIMPAPKDADNPYFRSKYASLPAVREAMQAAFAKHGLSIVQIAETEGTQIKLRTLLLHSSGQTLDCGTLKSEVDITNPQKMASCITYFRRYAISAVAQVVSDEPDDDGNAASQPAKGKPTTSKALTAKDVATIQSAIAQASTIEELATVTKGAAYQTLKAHGPEAAYKHTSDLAKARHTLLLTPPAEQAGEQPDEESKPF